MSHKRNVIMFEWLANGLEKQITFFYFICLMKPKRCNCLNRKRVVGNEYQYFLFTMNVELDTIVKKPFLRYSRCHDELVIVKKK